MTMKYCCICEREGEKPNFYGHIKSNKDLLTNMNKNKV